MKKSKSILLRILFIAAVVTTVLGIGISDGSVHAAVNDKSDGVYFSEAYATPDGDLSVAYDGNETDLTYKWFIDSEMVEGESESTFDITEEHYQKTIKAEVWSADSKIGEASIFCSKLPVLYIDTENGAEVVTKEYYINAEMHLQRNDNYSADSELYTGATEIKGRGNSTWELFPKKPYRLKLDKKADLFGMGKSKHWVLLANYIDESNMRNMLAGEIATRMGVGAMDGTWVEVVMNGENVGTYMLCEHVRLSDDRVDVFDWESAGEDIVGAIAAANGYTEEETDALTDYMVEEDMSWISAGEVTFNGNTYKTADYYEDLPDSFSGGYLLEMDYGYDEVSKFTTDNGAKLMFKSPEFISTDEVAMDTVKNYIQTFEDALYSKDFNTTSEDRVVSYSELCDVDSMVKYWLASELLMNEIGCKSTYIQKDIDSLLEFGPVWDFDFSSGSVSPFSSQNAEDWTSDNKYWEGTQDKWWFCEAMTDPYFAVKAREAYLEQEDFLKSVVSDGGLLDEWYEYLKESGEYNYEIWQYSRGFEADYNALDEWFAKRLDWIDDQFATNSSAMASLGVTLGDGLDLDLSGEMVASNGANAYIAEVGNETYYLTIWTDEEKYPEVNYYINSKYQGTATVTDGKVTIAIREEQFTENVGDDNVITVWGKDAEGNLVEQQYLTLKMTSDKQFYNVVFNDMGGTYSTKAMAGEKVYAAEPQQQEALTIFEGWSDGVKTYAAGEWIPVSGNMVLNAVWATCSDGTYTHDLSKVDGEIVCIRSGCNVTRDDSKSYIDVTACTLSCSNRYTNYYTGKEIKPVIGLSYNGEALVAGEDYTVEYKNNIDAGYATYVVKGIHEEGYTGEYELSYKILPGAISGAKILMPSTSLLVNGEAEPEITLTYNGMTLTEGTDYTLTFKDNTAEGTASVVITGKGNFEGSVTKTYDVVTASKDISGCVFSSLSTKAYTGSAIKPTVTVKDGSKTLVAGIDYTVSYSNNTKCGTATVKVTGVAKNGYTGTKSLSFLIRPGKTTTTVSNVSYNQQKLTWSEVAGATKYNIYKSTNNKTFKYVTSVKASSDRVYKSKGLDAGITYYYKVRAVREEKVNGATVKYWGIKPAAVSKKTVLYKGTIKSAKNTAKGTATIKWNSVNGAHGYKIYRSTTGKVGSYKLYKTVKRVNYFKNTGLTKGKTYYYKVKPYRTVNGKKVYGTTSSAKSVKITK